MGIIATAYACPNCGSSVMVPIFAESAQCDVCGFELKVLKPEIIAEM